MGFEAPTHTVDAFPSPPRPLSRGQQLRRGVVIGNFPPRHCGIATFTRDTLASLRAATPKTAWRVVAMNEPNTQRDYPDDVTDVVAQDHPQAYDDLAHSLNRWDADVVFLQHEFGIFGGPDGSYILRTLRRLRAPVIVTLHTVLEHPTVSQRNVLDEILEIAASVIVMTEIAADLLVRTHRAGPAKVHVVPHGAPSRPFAPPLGFKADLGLDGRKMIMTFGLLSPNKGLETIIRALPTVISRVPEVIYLIVGATHPNLIEREGEAYRHSLERLAQELGVDSSLRFINRYVDDEELVDLLRAADLYVTPYQSEAQVTSGTLSYAVALGKPVISTPYWHARELLSDGVGILCPFNDDAAFSQAIAALLVEDQAREGMARRAYKAGESSQWSKVADAILDLTVIARDDHCRRRTKRFRALLNPARQALLRMSDDCGMLQHSCFGIPDRRHGYCTDDNARALGLLARLSALEVLSPDSDRLLDAAAAFVNHAWNPPAQRFRNFMGYDRRWLDDAGSDDCNGRAFEGIAIAAACAARQSVRSWAGSLFRVVLPHAMEWRSLRGSALVVRALERAAGKAISPDEARLGMAAPAERLHTAATRGLSQHHRWIEQGFTYDNGILPAALIRAGSFLEDPALLSTGLDLLEILAERQTGVDGSFAPIATSGFDSGSDHEMFDQQPLEALAMIDAYVAAWRATGDRDHVSAARRVFNWFGGDNVHGIALATPGDGVCHDGLTPDGLNMNHGAESILSYHLAAMEMRELYIGRVHRRTA